MQLYSHFEERGYRLEAYIPNDDDDLVAFEIRIFIEDQRKKTLLIPMLYVPVFGVDIGDVNTLESAADEIMKALPDVNAFDDATTTSLELIEKRFGGEELRHRRARGQKEVHGQFQWTGNAFFETVIAPIFGDAEDGKKWMKEKKTELGDRTPEEALRLGMAREVLQLLGLQSRPSSES